MIKNLLENPFRSLALLLAGLSFFLGFLVIAGWHTGSSALVQWSPDIVPMQYNTALAHALTGLALLSLCTAGRLRIAGLAAAFLVLILSFLTGLQYVTGQDYGLDALLMDPLRQSQTKTVFPGRMAPSTVICFILISAAILFWRLMKEGENKLNAVMIPVGMVLAFSASALAGYVFGVESAYGWWSMSNIAPQTAAGLFLESTSLAAFVLGSGQYRELLKGAWKPALIAVAGIAITLAVAQTILDQGRQRIEMQAQASAAKVARAVEHDLGSRLKELSAMQARWEAQSGIPTGQWRADAKNLLDNNVSYRFIALIDTDYQLYEPVPVSGSPVILGSADIDRQKLKDATERNRPHVARLSNAGNREKLLAIFLPLRGRTGFDGFVAAVYDPGKGLESFLGYDVGEFHYEIFDDHGLLASNFLAKNAYTWETSHETKVFVQEIPYTIRVYLNAASYKNSGLVFLIFVSGLCVSVLLANAFYRATRMRRIADRLGESQAKLECILDNMVDGLITIDDKGIVQSYNSACERIFGYMAREVIGQNVKMLMPPHYADNHDRYIESYKNTGQAKIIGIGREVEGQRRDGTVFPIDLSIAEMMQDGKRTFSGIVRDITERRKAEEQLKRINEELEQFAYIASHDLKAPLRGIDNLAKWITEDLSDVLTDDAREKMSLLRGRVSRLEMLLEDILQYSRAGRIVDEPIEVDTADMVRNIFESIAMPEGFRIKIPENMPVLTTSYTPLHQMFLNLISNVRKHHDRNEGCIEIRVEDRGAFYEFSVEDDGPGIPEEYHERVFKMFQTLKPRDEKESSGLGLSIVKKLVEWQGGRVWVVSRDGGRGTAFHFLWRKKPVTEERKKDAA